MIQTSYRPNYRPEIEELLNSALKEYELLLKGKQANIKSFADEILKCAKAEQSDYLYATAYHYLVEHYVKENDRLNILYNAYEGMRYQKKIGEFYWIAKAWYYLGLYAVFFGNSAKTVECYMTCIDYCDKYSFEKLGFKSCAALADIFRRIKNYDRAIYYYEKAERYYEASGESELKDEYVYLYAHKGFCMLVTDRMAGAKSCKLKIEAYINEMMNRGKSYPEFIVHTYFAMYKHFRCTEEEREAEIRIVESVIGEVKDYYKYWNDILAYMTLLEMLDRKKELSALIDHYITRCAIENAPFEIFELVLKKGIQCAIANADNINYIAYSRRYFDLIDEEDAKRAVRISKAEKVHMENANIQKNSNKII